MNKFFTVSWPPRALLLSAGLLLASLCQAGPLVSSSSALNYHVVVNTADLPNPGSTGWLDLQFNPGLDTAPAASAKVSNFAGALKAGVAAIPFGAVSGSLPGTLLFSNAAGWNDMFQAIVMGGVFSFDLSFGGAFASAIGADAGSTFSLALYGEDQATELGSSATSGSLLSFDLANDLTMTNNNTTLAEVSPVPEPQGWLLALTALVLLRMVKRPLAAKAGLS
ncbi:NF038129 family PEP-CTERM protein [Roseateles sp.]|uniref:NF038129 family PEP-CTERM protein n=1 Tax=Roseateles sp. TaxID=1971397 RepID=UPI003BA76F65